MSGSHESSRRALLAGGAAAAGVALIAGGERGDAAKRKTKGKGKRKKPKAPLPPLVSVIVRVTNVTGQATGSTYLVRMDMSFFDLRQTPADPANWVDWTAVVPGGSAAAMDAAIRSAVRTFNENHNLWPVPADCLAILIV